MKVWITSHPALYPPPPTLQTHTPTFTCTSIICLVTFNATPCLTCCKILYHHFIFTCSVNLADYYVAGDPPGVQLNLDLIINLSFPKSLNRFVCSAGRNSTALLSWTQASGVCSKDHVLELMHKGPLSEQRYVNMCACHPHLALHK